MIKESAQLHQPPTTSDGNILLAAKGGGIAFAGNLSVYIIRFAFSIVIARLLGAELLGLYSLGQTVTDVAGIMAALGLSAGMVRYIPIAISQKDKSRLWGIIQTGLAIPIMVGLVLALGVFLLADPLSIRLFGRPDLAPVLRLSSVGIPLLALISVMAAITQGFKRMEFKVYSQDITLNLSKLILSVALLAIGLSVMGAVAAYIISLAVTVVMLFFFVNHLFPLNRPLRAAQRNTKDMLRFTLPVYLSQLLNEFSGSIETVVLGFFGSVSGVGIYTAVLRVSGIGSMFLSSLTRIAAPLFSDLHSQGKIDQLKRVYQTTTKWAMTFNLPIFLTMAIFARPLLSIFGVDFVAGASGLIILAFATLFNASTGMCGSIITMTGHSKLNLANSIIDLTANIGLVLLFVPRWGIVGAALAGSLSIILINTMRLVEVFVLLRIWPYNPSFLKPIAAALVAAGVAYLANIWLAFLPTIAQILAGAAGLWGAYALAIVSLRLSDEDRLVLNRLWSRFTPR